LTYDDVKLAYDLSCCAIIITETIFPAHSTLSLTKLD